MREDDTTVCSDAGENGQQDVSLQGLGLVDDDERIVQRPTTDVRQGKNFEHSPVGDLIDHLGRCHRVQRVENGLSPRRHLLVLGTRQVAQVLTTNGIERTKHDDLAVLTPLQNRLQSSAEGKRALARSRSATQRHDAHLGIHQQVQGDPLLRASTFKTKSLPITTHEADPLVRGHTS